MYYAYVLKSKNTGKYYIGSCENIEARLKRHNSGRNKSTKSGVPWVLVYREIFSTRQETYKREFQIKSFKGGAAFRKLILS